MIDSAIFCSVKNEGRYALRCLDFKIQNLFIFCLKYHVSLADIDCWKKPANTRSG